MTGVEAICEAVAAADVYVPEPPRPLFRDLPDPEPFPVEVLGEILAPAANAIHDIIQSPMAVGAQSVLATATLAAQGCANVRLPHGSERPLSNFFVAILDTGERKTAADDLASTPIRQREAQLTITHKPSLAEHQVQQAVFDAEWKKITGSRNLSAAEKAQHLRNLGPKPEPPPYPMLVCGEPTYEGLFRLLRDGPHSVGVFSNEGGQLLGGYALNDDNRLKTAAGLSDGWDGKPWKRVRGGDGLTLLPHRRVTLNLMVQPLVAAPLLGDTLLRDQGLLSRILVCAPRPASGTRFWKDPQPHSHQALATYAQRMLDLLCRSPIADEEIYPAMVFTTQARSMWIAFADSIEAQLGAEGGLSTVRGLANKAAEHAARLAGVLELVANPEARAIAEPMLGAGIELIQFFLTEAVRLYEGMQVNTDLQQAARLLRWLHTSWTEPYISPVEVYQRGPREFREKDQASAALRILEEHGWLMPLQGGHEVAGQRRRDVWLIVKG